MLARAWGKASFLENQEMLDALAAILPDLDGVLLVYLFGSQNTGLTGPMSDYDFGVLVDPSMDGPKIQARIAHELAKALKSDRVDAVLLNSAPIELAYAIVAQGRPIYQRNLLTKVEYEARIMGLYGDYLPVLRAQRDDILRGDEHAHRVHRYREALGRAEHTLDQIEATKRQGQG
jgi:predicted nucleotidyltransferase